MSRYNKMLIKVPTDVVDDAIKLLTNAKDKEELERMKRNSALRKFVEIDPDLLFKKQIKALKKTAEARKGEAAWKQDIEFLYQAMRDPSTLSVKNLVEFNSAFKKYMEDAFIKGWVFERGEHGSLTPYLAVRSTYTPSSRHTSESVTIDLAYVDVSGEESSSRIHVHYGDLLSAYKVMNREAAEKAAEELRKAQEEAEDEDEDAAETDDNSVAARRKRRQAEQAILDRLRKLSSLPEGVPIDRLLAQLGFYKETTELHEAYDDQLNRFMKLIGLYGAQLHVRGTGQMIGGYYWGSQEQTMLVDGRKAKAIMDTRPLQSIGGESTGRKRRRNEEDEEGVESGDAIDVDTLTKDDFFKAKTPDEVTLYSVAGRKELYTVPLHLMLKIFHLEKHNFYKLHVVNIKPYKYKPEMISQLVLPDDVLEIAEMLIAGEAEDYEDIVEGKSQGTMVTCVGDPGLGKTLLAEVFSESVGKPLYKIQAAQLGLDPETLEKELKLLLHRAERWGCIMMIDEANAYIHDRGVDVLQNAIVGVFLRLLEYYRGIIILTTNQTNADGTDMDIDDAILSRSNAVVPFTLPTEKLAKKIWRNQAKLLKANITDEVINEAVKHFAFSGRSIRQLLRLTWGLVRRKKEDTVTLERLIAARKFIAVSRHERNKQIEKDAEAKPTRTSQ